MQQIKKMSFSGFWAVPVNDGLGRCISENSKKKPLFSLIYRTIVWKKKYTHACTKKSKTCLFQGYGVVPASVGAFQKTPKMTFFKIYICFSIFKKNAQKNRKTTNKKNRKYFVSYMAITCSRLFFWIANLKGIFQFRVNQKNSFVNVLEIPKVSFLNSKNSIRSLLGFLKCKK